MGGGKKLENLEKTHVNKGLLEHGKLCTDNNPSLGLYHGPWSCLAAVLTTAPFICFFGLLAFNCVYFPLSYFLLIWHGGHP